VWKVIQPLVDILQGCASDFSCKSNVYCADVKSNFPDPDLSLSSIGGVENGGHAAEIIVLRENTIQIYIGFMMHGYGHAKKFFSELKEFMVKHNFSSIKDFRGMSLQYFMTHTDLVRRQQEDIQERKAILKSIQRQSFHQHKR
jgi:dihydropyrimidine dehydrogenase (NADP+)